MSTGMKQMAVFLGIYNRGYPLYEKYHNTPKTPNRLDPIPSILMINRWDGKIGFPGGKIDEGETQLQALRRELKEEINYDLVTTPLYVCMVETPRAFLYFYRLEVSFEEMKEIMRNAQNAEHFYCEITGVFLQHLRTYADDKGLRSLLKSGNLCPGVEEEIKTLMREHMFITDSGTTITSEGSEW